MIYLRKIGCLLLIALLSFPCFAKKRIYLQGNDKGPKSVIPLLPIQAWLEDNNKDLLLDFSTILWTVQVTVSNSEGEVVYEQSVVTQPSILISLKEEIKEGSSIVITDGDNLVYGKI